ncbi:hypothetical protein GCM10027167_44640 [Nocardia heshunensis]
MAASLRLETVRSEEESGNGGGSAGGKDIDDLSDSDKGFLTVPRNSGLPGNGTCPLWIRWDIR